MLRPLRVVQTWDHSSWRSSKWAVKIFCSKCPATKFVRPKSSNLRDDLWRWTWLHKVKQILSNCWPVRCTATRATSLNAYYSSGGSSINCWKPDSWNRTRLSIYANIKFPEFRYERRRFNRNSQWNRTKIEALPHELWTFLNYKSEYDRRNVPSLVKW